MSLRHKILCFVLPFFPTEDAWKPHFQRLWNVTVTLYCWNNFLLVKQSKTFLWKIHIHFIPNAAGTVQHQEMAGVLKFENNNNLPNTGDQTYFSLSMSLLVSNNLNPAIFSTARLLKNPTSPVPKPIRSARVHLRTMYWNIWTFFLDLQSCLNRSFSTILKYGKIHIT